MTLPKTSVFLAILAVGAGATALSAMPASAQMFRNRQPVSVNFTYDADASAATNYRNLLIKVRRACDKNGPLALGGPAEERACVEQMTNQAVAQINRPEINVAHAAATGAPDRRELAVR